MPSRSFSDEIVLSLGEFPSPAISRARLLAVFDKTVAQSPEILQIPHPDVVSALKDGVLAHFSSISWLLVISRFFSGQFPPCQCIQDSLPASPAVSAVSNLQDHSLGSPALSRLSRLYLQRVSPYQRDQFLLRQVQSCQSHPDSLRLPRLQSCCNPSPPMSRLFRWFNRGLELWIPGGNQRGRGAESVRIRGVQCRDYRRKSAQSCFAFANKFLRSEIVKSLVICSSLAESKWVMD